MLSSLIPSKTRRKILKLFFTNIDSSYHLRRVGREVEEEINAVKRELDILENAQVLRKERRVNKVIYTLNKDWLYFDEFLSIFAKQEGLVLNLRKNISRIGKVKFIALTTRFARKEAVEPGGIYLLLIGTVVLPEVAALVEEAQKTFPYEINFTVMSEEEFGFRKKNNDPFIWKFLREPKIMIRGSEVELVAN